jgi:hypothetical protein
MYVGRNGPTFRHSWWSCQDGSMIAAVINAPPIGAQAASRTMARAATRRGSRTFSTDKGTCRPQSERTFRSSARVGGLKTG